MHAGASRQFAALGLNCAGVLGCTRRMVDAWKRQRAYVGWALDALAGTPEVRLYRLPGACWARLPRHTLMAPLRPSRNGACRRRTCALQLLRCWEHRRQGYHVQGRRALGCMHASPPVSEHLEPVLASRQGLEMRNGLEALRAGHSAPDLAAQGLQPLGPGANLTFSSGAWTISLDPGTGAPAAWRPQHLPVSIPPSCPLACPAALGGFRRPLLRLGCMQEACTAVACAFASLPSKAAECTCEIRQAGRSRRRCAGGAAAAVRRQGGRAVGWRGCALGRLCLQQLYRGGLRHHLGRVPVHQPGQLVGGHGLRQAQLLQRAPAARRCGGRHAAGLGPAGALPTAPPSVGRASRESPARCTAGSQRKDPWVPGLCVGHMFSSSLSSNRLDMRTGPYGPSWNCPVK